MNTMSKFFSWKCTRSKCTSWISSRVTQKGGQLVTLMLQRYAHLSLSLSFSLWENKRWPSFSRVWFSSWFALYVVGSYWNTVLQVLTGNSLVNRTVLNILIDSDQTWWGNMKLARGGLFLWKVRRGIPSLCTGTRTRPLCESLTQLCHRNPGINTAVDVFTSQQIVGNFLTPLEISLNVLDIWVAWSYLAQSENSK